MSVKLCGELARYAVPRTRWSVHVIWLGYVLAKFAYASDASAAVPSGVNRSDTVYVTDVPGCTPRSTRGKNVARPSGAVVLISGTYVCHPVFFHPPYIGTDSSGTTLVTTPEP